MALKETLEAIVRKLQQGKYPNEQSISMGIVIPVLGELGWDTTDPDFVWPEYSVKNGRVDFALCYAISSATFSATNSTASPKVFASTT